MDTVIQKALGDKADYYLGFAAPKIGKDRLHLPGPDFVDRIFAPSDRNNRVLTNLQRFFRTGRLAGTGYERGDERSLFSWRWAPCLSLDRRAA